MMNAAEWNGIENDYSALPAKDGQQSSNRGAESYTSLSHCRTQFREFCSGTSKEAIYLIEEEKFCLVLHLIAHIEQCLDIVGERRVGF